MSSCVIMITGHTMKVHVNHMPHFIVKTCKMNTFVLAQPVAIKSGRGLLEERPDEVDEMRNKDHGACCSSADDRRSPDPELRIQKEHNLSKSLLSADGAGVGAQVRRWSV